MNINKHEQKYKEYLKLDKRYCDLLKQKWAIESIKLDKPIHNGFVRFLRIRPEYYKNADYPKMLEAFNLIGHTKVYSKTKDFVVKVRGNKITKDNNHPRLKYIIDPRFAYYVTDALREKKIKTIEDLSKFIKKIDNIYRCNCNQQKLYGRFIQHYEFSKPWLLEERTEINWLTHYTPIDSDIESELANITKKMYNENAWNKLYGRTTDGDYELQYVIKKDKIHGYLHGWPKPRIDEIYEWEI